MAQPAPALLASHEPRPSTASACVAAGNTVFDQPPRLAMTYGQRLALPESTPRPDGCSGDPGSVPPGTSERRACADAPAAWARSATIEQAVERNRCDRWRRRRPTSCTLREPTRDGTRRSTTRQRRGNHAVGAARRQGRIRSRAKAPVVRHGQTCPSFVRVRRPQPRAGPDRDAVRPSWRRRRTHRRSERSWRARSSAKITERCKAAAPLPAPFAAAAGGAVRACAASAQPSAAPCAARRRRRESRAAARASGDRGARRAGAARAPPPSQRGSGAARSSGPCHAAAAACQRRRATRPPAGASRRSGHRRRRALRAAGARRAAARRRARRASCTRNGARSCIRGGTRAGPSPPPAAAGLRAAVASR